MVTAEDLRLGMSPGTSPCIKGGQIAFQANTHSLWVHDVAGATSQDFRLGMMPNTSPALTTITTSVKAQQTTNVSIASQANTESLWISGDVPNDGADQELGMMAGTSPCYSFGVVAFQANTGNLWAGYLGTPNDMKLGMMAGTSPSMAIDLDDDFEVCIAFQANTGNLWLSTDHPNRGTNTGLGMMRNSSPSIAVIV